MKLNILCQSPVPEGSDPRQAIANTVELAHLADAAGYHRFWVAEHHADPALASASPEILVAHIAATTERIRVGSGGVLLPFYSPLKVAEQFRLLAALHPDRIDLGVGRSGGSEGEAPKALGYRAREPWEALDELLGWLRGSHLRPATFANPGGELALPTPWVLGTSAQSARHAGERGLPYAFGAFLDPRGMIPALTAYHQHFRPSVWSERPLVNVAVYVQAAATAAEAHELTRSSERWFIDCLVRGRCRPFPDPARLPAPDWTPVEAAMVELRRRTAIVGSYDEVVERLRALAAETAADELTLITIPWSHAARLQSYAGIARAAGLVAQPDRDAPRGSAPATPTPRS